MDYPERMAFMYWQKWRKDTASRPTKKKDGRSTTLQQENKVWRETMEFLYDDFDAETEEEYEEEEEEEAGEPAEGDGLDEAEPSSDMSSR